MGWVAVAPVAVAVDDAAAASKPIHAAFDATGLGRTICWEGEVVAAAMDGKRRRVAEPSCSASVPWLMSMSRKK